MKKTLAEKKNKAPVKKEAEERSFPIVAIGASAGGLEAITRFLHELSPITGMAFIYVQHLSPDHKSILTSLLSNATTMPVQEVTNKILMQPNHLYVIPPNKEMTVIDGHIKLTVRKKDRVANLPIDAFFCTLADKHKKDAIGIILSGNATDGTKGLMAIKEGGGLTFAQDDSAKNSSMPRSATNAGAVDFVMSPKDIAIEINNLSKQNYLKKGVLRVGKEDEIDNNDVDLKSILKILHDEVGVDFSHYKMSTIKRRILRRMLLHKIKTLQHYAKLMTKQQEEVQDLYQDLLINVTDFFREPAAHQYLKTTLLPRLLKSKKSGEVLRIWVPACSTGEEAYSIAMSILEIQNATTHDVPVHIFATDLSAKAIAKARQGEYSKHELESVSPKRLQKFYTKSDDNYRIVKTVRDMCVFAPHNILRDPPFSHVDFISCCNLLIYLDTAAQKKVLATFHYALNDKAYLMLGKSETIGASVQLFTHINNKFKIYSRKKNTGVRKLPELLPRLQNPAAKTNVLLKNRVSVQKSISLPSHTLGNAIDAVLLSNYMPASMVVNYDMDILEFRGATDIYLSHTSGKASLNILKITRPEIAFELRTTIQRVIKTKQKIRVDGVEIRVDNILRLVSIEVVPLNIDTDDQLLLILFTEQQRVDVYTDNSGKTNSNITIKDRRIKKLEKELAEAHASMVSFSHEHDLFTQELQSANEEIVSSNEELQSVNEELETSKEEIEAANEELLSANEELQTRNELLAESYDYSEAITATIHEPMIILDKDLFVKSANKSFYKKFAVKPEETEGELLYNLGNKQWDIPGLCQLLDDIIPNNAFFLDFEVKHTFPGIGERIMLLNANRIMQKSHHEQLILLAIDDITDRTIISNKEKEHLKQDNLEKKAQNELLEKAVQERTIELQYANQSLKYSVNELEQKNKDLQAFAYVSSHDLQEPLRKIQNFASRILDKENHNLSAEGKDSFSRIQASAGRMRQLIDNLLAFSGISLADRKFEEVDLNTFIEEIKTELGENFEEKNATLVTSGLTCIHIIPFQFRQLIFNLINNSLKFADPLRPCHINITCVIALGNTFDYDKLDAHTKYCHLQISDNGIGFEPQFNERIFEVFQKLHGKEKFAGTGIGLAIVKKIVDNHNGFIRANGQLNIGATFDIFIPLTPLPIAI